MSYDIHVWLRFRTMYIQSCNKFERAYLKTMHAFTIKTEVQVHARSKHFIFIILLFYISIEFDEQKKSFTVEIKIIGPVGKSKTNKQFYKQYALHKQYRDMIRYVFY